MRKRVRDQAGDEINVTPLMDVVFILLVFFVVTTSFVKESGIDVSRPSSTPNKSPDASHVALYVDEDDQFRINGRTISADAVGANLERQLAVLPDASLIIVCARKAKTQSLVLALDQGTAAGFESISVTAVTAQ